VTVHRGWEDFRIADSVVSAEIYCTPETQHGMYDPEVIIFEIRMQTLRWEIAGDETPLHLFKYSSILMI